METLGDGLQKELARNRELLVEYRAIGPSGMFGSAMIELGIQTAEKAMLENDLLAMIKAYKALREFE